jgi:hypothetical protein
MLEVLEEVDVEIEKHILFEEINPKITGVPIRFVLVPLKHFIKDYEVSPNFIKLSDDNLNDYAQMLNDILDFSIENCIRNRVFENYPESGNIIYNKNSIIAQEIKKYEFKLNRFTKNVFPKAVSCLKYYKNGTTANFNNLLNSLADKSVEKVPENSNKIDLEKIIQWFNKEFKKYKVEENIVKFIKKCRYQLDCVKFKDSEKHKNNYRLFTDEKSLIDWFKSDRSTKVLLKTDGPLSKKSSS